MISRCKPLKYTYEKEIVMYAYFKKLDYFSTECIYSPNAYRGHARAYIKDLEKIRPTTIIDIIHSGEQLVVGDKARARLPDQSLCKQCGYISSQEICKACVLLEGLNRGLPQLGVGKSSKHKKTLEQLRDSSIICQVSNISTNYIRFTCNFQYGTPSINNCFKII